jgi:hypothetical protein
MKIYILVLCTLSRIWRWMRAERSGWSPGRRWRREEEPEEADGGGGRERAGK